MPKTGWFARGFREFLVRGRHRSVTGAKEQTSLGRTGNSVGGQGRPGRRAGGRAATGCLVLPGGARTRHFV